MRFSLFLTAVLNVLLGAVSAWGQVYGLDNATPFTPYLNGVFPTRPPSGGATFATAVAFPNLSFTEPMFLTPYPGSNFLMMVTPNRGYIYVTYKWRPNPAGGANADYAGRFAEGNDSTAPSRSRSRCDHESHPAVRL